jgi:hypothetical protein
VLTTTPVGASDVVDPVEVVSEPVDCSVVVESAFVVDDADDSDVDDVDSEAAESDVSAHATPHP